MNKLGVGILLIIWLCISLALAGSVIGLILFVRADHNLSTFRGDEGMSSWFRIGHKLVDKL